MGKVRQEWFRLDDGRVVVATAARSWVVPAEAAGEGGPYAAPMQGPGSVETTGRLLDGAVALGQRDARRGGVRAPPLTAERWVWRLAGLYHTTTVTPGLLLEAAERFEAEGRRALAEWARKKEREERGHDELALRDIAALGYDPERTVALLRPPTALALADWFRRAVRSDEPARCVGYAYALERLALTGGRAYIEHVESLLPPGVRATRCLRVHSAIGSDTRHVRDTVELVATLSAGERRRICLATHATTVLCWSSPPKGHVADDHLRRALAQARAVST